MRLTLKTHMHFTIVKTRQRKFFSLLILKLIPGSEWVVRLEVRDLDGRPLSETELSSLTLPRGLPLKRGGWRRRTASSSVIGDC